MKELKIGWWRSSSILLLSRYSCAVNVRFVVYIDFQVFYNLNQPGIFRFFCSFWFALSLSLNIFLRISLFRSLISLFAKFMYYNLWNFRISFYYSPTTATTLLKTCKVPKLDITLSRISSVIIIELVN